MGGVQQLHDLDDLFEHGHKSALELKKPVTGDGTLKINASLASTVSSLEVVDRSDEEAIQKKIKLLKAREKSIREERHQLESELRNLIFKRYMDLSEKIELKEL